MIHLPANFLLKYQNLQTRCATEVDKDGILQGQFLILDDPWGFCGPDCPTHEETVTWNTDETFKMTLTYNNPLLFSGLELYGTLLAGIFICGLMIVLVPAMGKTTVQSIFYYDNLINSSHDDVRQDGQDAKVLGSVLE